MSSGALPRPGFPFGRVRDLIFPIGIIASVLVLLVPLPTPVIDLMLAANISVAVIVLLTTIYVRTPLEFSIFPSLLLATTLGRLVLNVATTRLVLTHAESQGMMAAGGVVKSFGEFVAGDKIVVGLIIFVIIVVIQFVVITKGATRISEVAARFALDGMPGRQMAIDADLNAGIIDEREAQRRRAEITQQADFFGAMDGASKFVRGDAIAGIVITIINIAGGMYVGMIDHGMTAADAAMVFTKLTIGDGLVTQIPAFLLAMAAGLLVTRSSADSDLPRDMLGQIFVHPEAMGVSSAFVFFLSFTGLPRWPLLMISTALAMMAATLITGSSSNVNLINGASECNIFWQVGSSATLGPSSTLRGTVMALTSITLTTNATLFGRALARNGSVTLDSNIVDASPCLTASGSASPSTSPSASASSSPSDSPSASPSPSDGPATSVTKPRGGPPWGPRLPYTGGWIPIGQSIAVGFVLILIGVLLRLRSSST